MAQRLHIDHVDQMIDINSPKLVEVEIRRDGQVIWIHVNGETKLRIQSPGSLWITDHRNAKEVK